MFLISYQFDLDGGRNRWDRCVPSPITANGWRKHMTSLREDLPVFAWGRILQCRQLVWEEKKFDAVFVVRVCSGSTSLALK